MEDFCDLLLGECSLGRLGIFFNEPFQYHLAGLLVAYSNKGIRLLKHGAFCLFVRGIFFQEVFISEDSILIFFLCVIGFSNPEVGVRSQGMLWKVAGEFFKFLLCLSKAFSLEIYLRIIV